MAFTRLSVTSTRALMELDPTEMTPVLNGVKRARCPLDGVPRLAKKGHDGEDLATELAAVSKALDRAGSAIVACGLQQCLVASDGVDSVDVKQMETLFLSLA